MIAFGERLREERKRFKLNQEEIALKVGVTKQTQGLYERGQRVPNAEYLAAMAKLGCDVLYVLTGRRAAQHSTREEHHTGGVYAKSRAASTAEPLNYRERAVLDCMRQLKPEHQRMLEGIAQSMLKTQKEQQVIEDFTSGNDGKKIGEDWWPEGPEVED